MSELTQFRDHARSMAGREHTLGCSPARAKPVLQANPATGTKWCRNDQSHERHTWTEKSRFGTGFELQWACAGICHGCNPESYRALWTRLADEIDEYLSDEPEPTLFGGAEG